jgi:hypothetical protein
MDSNIIQVESLSHMSFDDILSLYRQGYKLEDRTSLIGNGMRSLATCQNTVTTGDTLTLIATAGAGIAPYSYHWTVTKPGGSVQTLADQTTNTYAFTTDGQYKISVYTTDSCTTGALSSGVQTCNVVASPAVVNGPCGQSTCYKCSGSSCVQDNVNGTFTTSGCGSGCGGGGGGCVSTGYNCEVGQTGYEINNCGNRRANSACNSVTATSYDCSGASGSPSYTCNAVSGTGGAYSKLTDCQTACVAGGTVTTDPCLVCDKNLNYCVAGQCINKKYALYGGAAVGVLVLILAMK